MEGTPMQIARATVAACFLAAAPVIAAQLPFEGLARGYPALRDSSGKKLADGDFSQWLDGERLHVRITYNGPGRRIEEYSVFRERPRLVQEQWSLREVRDGKLYRHFQVDFKSGSASAKKLEENELKQWSEQVEIEPGRTFAGFGFTLAIKALRQRLVKGERVELKAVGFTPKPRVVSVEIAHEGLDQMRMGGRAVRADRFLIHPEIPKIAELFVKVPDTHIWLANPAPAGFVRWEGPLAEPKDQIVRVDVLPGAESGPATPVGTSGRR
jgi:hypothetical protein